MKKADSLTFTAMVVAVIMILAACKKEDSQQSEISIQSLSGSYKIASWTYKFGNQPEEDLMILLNPCQRDDVLTLKTDKTYTSADAGVQCSPPDDYNGNWDLLPTSKLSLFGDEWVIESFDGQTLVISITSTSSGTAEVEKRTLKRSS